MITGLAVAVAFALCVIPLFPSETPTLVVDFTPKFVDGQFKVAGGIAVAIVVWPLYCVLVFLFLRQGAAVAKANIASLSEGGD